MELLFNLLPVGLSLLGFGLAAWLESDHPRGSRAVVVGSKYALVVTALAATPALLLVMSLEEGKSLGAMAMATFFLALVGAGAGLIAFGVGCLVGWAEAAPPEATRDGDGPVFPSQEPEDP